LNRRPLPARKLSRWRRPGRGATRRMESAVSADVPHFIWEFQNQVNEACTEIVIKQQIEAGQPPLYTLPGEGYGSGGYGSGSYGS